MAGSPETFGFETEARQLLKLMIHSLYSNREIFLRELISNASDAIDKLRFRTIAEPELAEDGQDFGIRVGFDADAGSLWVEDNGIGMSRQEAIDHLGTIARSGTTEFLNQLSGDQQKDATLIGQFGVGFYSAFIVADEVEVRTRAAGGDGGTLWTSRGEDAFTVSDLTEAPRGTRVTLRLREDAREFADNFRLRSLVRKYSDHISVPVYLPTVAAPDGEEEAAEPASTETAWETVNEATALWTRPRSEIGDEEYQAFYKHIAHDFEDPMRWSHNRVEGKFDYTSLLYVPRRAPFDLWSREAPRGLKLYVQRVFIMDDADQFLPLYLRFVKGVVDSSDLPLNISRELLQEDERVASIRTALTKRVLSTLKSLANQSPEDYQAFWDEFGEVLKEGAGEDPANREAIAELLRFSSTHIDSNAKSVGLKDYVSRLQEGQDNLYYLVAESHQIAASSPHLEVFRERGLEVLLLYDRIDEWMMSNLREFDGKSFQDITRSGLVLPGDKPADAEGDEEKSGDEAEPEVEDGLASRIKSALGDRVKAVRVSARLRDSAACLVQSEFGPGRQMQRIMQATGQPFAAQAPDFEYNAAHPLLKRLDQEPDEDRFADLALVLFDQAALAEGDGLKDAADYVGRINRLLLDLLQRPDDKPGD